MNRKIKKILPIVLVVIVIVLFLINIFQGNTEIVIPDSDKTWNDSEMFTNTEYQKKQVKDMRDEYNAFDYNYTIDEPYVKVNPYGINPLSAYIIFNSQEPVKYSYTVHSENEENNFTYENEEYNSEVIIPVIGLFEDTANVVTLTTVDENDNKNTADVVITTASAEYNKVNVKVESEISDELANGWFFDSYYNGFDMNGNIRYNLNVGVEDNYMKFNAGSFYVKVDNYQTIYEMDIMGKIVRTFRTPSAEYNFHHDLVNATNGDVYALASYNVDLPDIPHAESLIFKYDTTSEYPIEIYDLYDLFDENLVSSYGTPNQNDPIHINSIDYYESSNEIIVSSQAQSFIAGLNADDMSINWIIQDEESNLENSDLALSVIDEDNFEQTSGQHTVFVNNNSKYSEYIDEGKLVISIFNNNNCKSSEGELQWKTYDSEIDASVCTYDESDVLVYAIDEEARTVQQIDTYKINKEYASIMSSVFSIAEDNFIIHYNKGNDPTSYLIDNEGNVLAKFTVNGYEGNGYYRTNFRSYDEITTMLDYV